MEILSSGQNKKNLWLLFYRHTFPEHKAVVLMKENDKQRFHTSVSRLIGRRSHICHMQMTTTAKGYMKIYRTKSRFEEMEFIRF